MPKKSSEYYDAIYSIGGNNLSYHKHFEKSPYIKIWKAVINNIPKNSICLDFGCGNGQFADALNSYRPGINYTGIDFSPEAIKQARKRCLSPNIKFYNKELDWWIDSGRFAKFTHYISLETLEHVDDELEFKFLQNIPDEKVVILSLPNFKSPAHIRTYPDAEMIKERYSGLLNITEHHEFIMNKETGAKITLVIGTKICQD